MKRIRQKIRPNTLPAKSVLWGDKAESLQANRDLYSTSDLKRPRYIAVDACDFCGRYIGVYRKFLFLRKIGWRFSCQKCYNENFNDRNPKEHKIVIDQTNFKKFKKN